MCSKGSVKHVAGHVQAPRMLCFLCLESLLASWQSQERLGLSCNHFIGMCTGPGMKSDTKSAMGALSKEVSKEVLPSRIIV